MHELRLNILRVYTLLWVNLKLFRVLGCDLDTNLSSDLVSRYLATLHLVASHRVVYDACELA